MDLSTLSQSMSGLTSDPLFNFGMGMMQASGPSLMPHNLGQSIAAGAAYSQQAQIKAQELRMQQMQAARYALQNQALAGVLGGQAGGRPAAPLGQPSSNAGGAPALASANGTPGQSFADPNQPAQPQAMSPASMSGGMTQDPMFGLQMAFDPNAAAQSYINRAYPQPTDFVKSLTAAGIDPNSQIGRSLIQDNIAKQNNIPPVSLRGGGYMFNPKTGGITNLPQASPGFQVIQDPQTGQFVEVPVAGGPAAVAASSTAAASGKATFAPMTYQDAKGVTHTTTQANFAGGLNSSYINATQQAESGGNPGAVSPAGAVGPMQTMPGTLASPGFGVQPAKDNSPEEQARVGRDYLGAMAQKYNGDPIAASAAYNWGPENFDKALAANNGNVFAALAQAPAQTQAYVQKVMSGTATQPAAQSGPAGIAGPSPGYTAGQVAAAGDNQKRYQDVINTGATAANRMNVYDNLRQLLSSGVQTGYGTEWKNHVESAIANTPVLQSLLPQSLQGKAIDYQVAMKYIAQGTLQRFQSQRGTGTDSQLEAVAHGNTNPEQLAGAMSQVSRYLQSQDMADLAKANAQQAWAQQNGHDYSKQDQFEDQWRSLNNPLAFQFKTADPAGKQAILKNLSAPQRNKLAQDVEKLSPFITTTPAGP